MPLGSAESLRLSYKTGLGRLVQGYTAYLRRSIQETAPGPQKPQTRTTSRSTQTNTSSIPNVTCSSNNHFNVSQVSTIISFNDTIAPNSTADIRSSCKTHRSREGFGVSVSKRINETAVSMGFRKTFTNLTDYSREGEAGMLGLLVIEAGRNVSHNVQHHPCQSPAIRQALVTRIMNSQDLERNRNIFLYHENFFHNLLRQRNDFELKTNYTKMINVQLEICPSNLTLCRNL